MPKIEDYALLGDLHTAALVSTAGSVDWLCLPRFDSPAAFAALLHNDEAGHWTLAPAGATTCTTRRYAGNTLVLETDWVTADGAVRVIDFMPPRADTPHLIRIAVGLDGEVAMRSTLRLRFDYGRVVPWVRNLGTQVHAIAGPDRVRLMSAVPLRGDHWETLADFTVRKGDRVPFVMSWAPGHDPQMPYVDAEQALSATEDFWTEWSAHAAYQTGPYSDAVDRSLITLKALTYEPTGGIVAAATTSLPEELGGVRNWDYRYCWLRDATYALQALLAAGYRLEAGAWRDWLLRSIAGQPETLQILYSIDGARRLPEADLPWLSGYEGSSPVRTGNAASGQLQLDVWGETLDALFLARQAGLPADPRRVGAAGRPDESSRISLARTGQRIVGGARRPAALHPLQGHGVGRRRPDGTIGRARTACPARRCAGNSSAIRSTTMSLPTRSTPGATPSPRPTGPPRSTPACC